MTRPKPKQRFWGRIAGGAELLAAAGCGLLTLACSSEALLLESRNGMLPAEAPVFEVIVPRPADSFADSVGITFLVRSEQDVEVVRPALLDLGVRHIRTFAQELRGIGSGLPGRVAGSELLVHLVVDPRLNADGSDLPRLLEEHPTLESLEGPNDFDAYGVDLTADEVRAAVLDLRSAIDRSGSTLSLVDGLDSQKSGAGDLSDWLDYANFERLRTRRLPGQPLDEYKASARTSCADCPLFVTECGYSNLAGNDHSVSEEAAARYLPRLLLWHFAQGIERTYLDDLREAQQPKGPHETQGLIRHDGQRKPAFEPLKRLLARTADPGPAFETTPLELHVAGAPATLRRVILQRREGTHLVLLWNELESFDGELGQTLSPTAVPIQVFLPGETSYALFRPALAAQTTEQGRSQRLELLVADDVLLLELGDSTGL